MKQLDCIARIIDRIITHAQDRPSLSELAEQAGYSPSHLQKTFKAYTGLSPQQFLDILTFNTAQQFLIDQAPTLEVAYQTGLSGQGRLHDLCVRVAGMRPGGIAGRGKGVTITYGRANTVWGCLLIAKTELGLCWLAFAHHGVEEEQMRENWPCADFVEDDDALSDTAKLIQDALTGATDQRIPLDLHGTNLQIQVWQALLRIPSGVSLNYAALGEAIGKKGSARAIGNAVGANPIALIIPCHRVIRATGVIDNYAWGNLRKRALLGLENPISAGPERL